MKAKAHRFTMTRRTNFAMFTSLGLALLLLGVTSAPVMTAFEDTETQVFPTEGRQSSLDEQIDCSGYTFEDLFEYDFALFELNILDDWATGDMYANAWVNGSNSAIVRDNLDGLFDTLPGGDNDWISTDERDAVRSIGPKCITDMETRLGMKEGVPHSGDVDWNDFEFVEEGIGLDEVNLVPESHPDARDCQNAGKSLDCKEVPTSTTDDMEISLFVADGETTNVRWDQLPTEGVSNFTLAMNITNMSDAALVVTFPVLQGLRIYDFRVVDNQPESGQTCDHIGEPSFTYLTSGALRVTQLVSFDRTQWDLECAMFMDFTTEEPVGNEPPEWTSTAPANNTKIPTQGTGTWMFVDKATGSAWATDDDGWALNCTFDEAGWSVSKNVIGDFLVTQPAGASQATATCTADDPLNQRNENDTRTWVFGTLFTATGTVDADGKNAVMSIQPGGLVTDFIINAQAVQNGQLGKAGDDVAVSGASSTDAIVSLDNIRPGSFELVVTAQAANMLDYSTNIDFGLVKPNSPPTVSVAVNFNGENATWDDSGYKFEMYGLVSDPDLEVVTLRLTICGEDYQGFNINGINWNVEVSTAICAAYGLTDYNVTITATDESGEDTPLFVEINPPVLDNVPVDPSTPTVVEDEPLPSISLLATLSMLGAAVLLRRKDEE